MILPKPKILKRLFVMWWYLTPEHDKKVVARVVAEATLFVHNYVLLSFAGGSTEMMRNLARWPRLLCAMQFYLFVFPEERVITRR